MYRYCSWFFPISFTHQRQHILISCSNHDPCPQVLFSWVISVTKLCWIHLCIRENFGKDHLWAQVIWLITSTLSHSSPGFYMSEVQVCLKQAISLFSMVFSTSLENFLPFSSNSKLSSANSFNLENEVWVNNIKEQACGYLMESQTVFPVVDRNVSSISDRL